LGRGAPKDEKQFFGHPRKLFILFTTEMWERFGYYGMRAVLLLYLTKHFLFDQQQGVAIYTAYVSLVYLTPLIGGLIADKYLGSRNAVKLGAVLMASGYFLLSFGGPQAREFVVHQENSYEIIVETEGEKSFQYLQTPASEKLRIGPAEGGGIAIENAAAAGLPAVIAADEYSKRVERNTALVYLAFLALALIVIGNGFFKPNISTMVGDLYTPEDRRRDAAFTIFYMGINLGAFLGQLLLPNVRVNFGFNVAFLAAAVGMLLALLISFLSDRALRGYGDPPNPERLKKGLGVVIAAASFAAVLPVWFLLQNDPGVAQAVLAFTPNAIKPFIEASPLVGLLLLGGGLLAFAAVVVFSVTRLDAISRDRMIVAVVLTFFSILFWALFEQAGTSLTLFADQNTDRRIFGWSMPPEQVQFFNPLIIILLAPLFSLLWTALAARGLEPPTPFKFAGGLVLVGVGFLVLVAGGSTANEAALVSIWWLALTYLIHTVGELLLSPVGLSMITRLSVPSLVGMMMGVWFLSSAMAQYVAGIIATFTATETLGGQVLDPKASLAGSLEVFRVIGITAVVVGGALLALAPLLRWAMHRDKPSPHELAAAQRVQPAKAQAA
jgi:POT family proton-dependent oligopeptide transporter